MAEVGELAPERFKRNQHAFALWDLGYESFFKHLQTH
ncbi:protein of unknown function (plasmid) [Enterobacter cancerogenus]|nr:protein of unknown function [Enterobacter cancerogenus]